MAERMTDAQISDYLASMRKWPKLPSDYGPETETIIRRCLRGEIEAGAYGNPIGPTAEPQATHEPSEPDKAAQEYNGQKDGLESYQLALEFKRHG